MGLDDPQEDMQHGGDRTARLWGVYTGREVAPFSHDDAVTGAALSADGSRVLTYSDRDGSARVWGVRRLSRIGHRLEQQGHVTAVAVSPDPAATLGPTAAAALRPRVFAVGGYDGDLALWRHDAATLERIPWRIKPLEGHKGRLRRLAFSPSGRFLASAAYDGTARVWDPRSGTSCALRAATEEAEARQGRTGREVYRVLFGPGESWLLTTSNDPQAPARLWTWDGAQCAPAAAPPLAPGRARTQAAALVRGPDGVEVIATGDDEGEIRVSRRAPGGDWVTLCDLKPHTKAVLDLGLAPDRGRLASAGEDGALVLTRLGASGCEGGPLAGHRGPVQAVAFAPDGSSLLSAAQDNEARVWSADGTPPATLVGHRERVNLALYSPDGAWLLTGSRDGDLRLWQTPRAPLPDPGSTGSWLTLAAGERGVMGAAFAPDGQDLVAGYWGNAALLWRLWSDRPPAPEVLAAWGEPRAQLTLVQEAERFRRENRLVAPGRAP